MKELALIGYNLCSKEAQQTWFFLSHIAYLSEKSFNCKPPNRAAFHCKKKL